MADHAGKMASNPRWLSYLTFGVRALGMPPELVVQRDTNNVSTQAQPAHECRAADNAYPNVPRETYARLAGRVERAT